MDLNNFQNKGKDKNKEPVNIDKKKIGIIVALVILGILGLLFGSKMKTDMDAEEAQALQEQQSAEEAELQKKLGEPHSARNYYLNEVKDPEKTNAAAASLIAHVISTGCTEAYDDLREKFDINSMEYLYKFVGGYKCKEFKSSPYVLQEAGENYEEYKIKFNSQEQYLLHLSLDIDGYAESFQIYYYETGDDILKEDSFQYQKDKEKKAERDAKEKERAEAEAAKQAEEEAKKAEEEAAKQAEEETTTEEVTEASELNN